MLRTRLVVLLALFLVAVEGQVVLGEEPNDMKALKDRAAQGDIEAQYNLWVIYSAGRGVPQHDAEALKWLGLAADQGHIRAQSSLGIMYAHGKGVPQDYVQAHMWYNLAAARATEKETRDMDAESRDGLAERMTPAQIAEAQKLAREWKSSLPGK